MPYKPKHGPGYHGADQFDLTGHIGPRFPEIYADPVWPMYSFDRPSHILWNAIGKKLCEKGWSDESIREWLASRATRYALDGALGEAIRTIGENYAADMSDA